MAGPTILQDNGDTLIVLLGGKRTTITREQYNEIEATTRYNRNFLGGQGSVGSGVKSLMGNINNVNVFDDMQAEGAATPSAPTQSISEAEGPTPASPGSASAWTGGADEAPAQIATPSISNEGYSLGVPDGESVVTAKGQEWITDMIQGGTGQLFSMSEGALDQIGGDYGDNYLFTDGGIIPLTEQAATWMEGQATAANTLEFGLFGVDIPGKPGLADAFATTAEDLQNPRDFFSELPPGVTMGVPDGANPDDYYPIGLAPKSEANNPMDSMMDRMLYVKNRGVGLPEVPRMHQPDPNVRDDVDSQIDTQVEGDDPEFPSMREEFEGTPEEIWKYKIDGRDYPEDLSKTEGGSDFDSFQGEDPEEEKARYKDPLFVPNLMASIADGMGNIDMSGVNYPVPTYQQGQYVSGPLGQSVQNLFRRGN